MKRFLIALFLSLSFSLFAEPFTLYGSKIGDNYKPVIENILKKNWILDPYSDDPTEENSTLTFTKVDIQKQINENLEISFENSELKYITYEKENILNSKNDIYIHEKEAESNFNQFFTKYGCKELNENNFITENNIEFSYHAILKPTNHIMTYSIMYSFCEH